MGESLGVLPPKGHWLTSAFILFIVITTPVVTQPPLCSELQFTCRNGDCVNILDRCNGFADCRDGSDEAGCQGEIKVIIIILCH